MTKIREFVASLYSPTAVTTQMVAALNETAPATFPVKEIMLNLQLFFYWLRDADQELAKEMGEDEELQTHMKTPIIPTMIGAEEQIDFIVKQLTELAKEIFFFIQDVPVTESIKNKLINAHSKLCDVTYLSEITLLYYRELNKQNGN